MLCQPELLGFCIMLQRWKELGCGHRAGVERHLRREKAGAEECVRQANGRRGKVLRHRVSYSHWWTHKWRPELVGNEFLVTERVLDLLRWGSECYGFNSDPLPTQSPFPSSILIKLCLNSGSVCWISVPTWSCCLLGHCPTGASQGALWWRIHLLVQERQETWVRPLGLEGPWRRKWQPTPVFLPGKSHGQRGLAGYSSWGHKESDMTEQLSMHTHKHTHTANDRHLPSGWREQPSNRCLCCHF